MNKKTTVKKSANKKPMNKQPANKQPANKQPANKQPTNKQPANKQLSKKQLDYFRAKLLAEKNRVLEEMNELQQGNLKQSITEASGENSRYSYHLGDVASLSYGREFSMGLAERQQKYLEQIDEALQRIDDGKYGICLVTGEPIAIERLEEVPVAKYSVKGKEMLERRKRQGG
jgi:DnaK suppressor protein